MQHLIHSYAYFIIGLLVMCPVNIHLFWVAIEALEKSVKYVQS